MSCHLVHDETDAAQHLENLRVALGVADPALPVRLVRPIGAAPYLHAGSGLFTEEIRVRAAATATDPGGYLWSWGEEITPITTPEIAAQRVLTVLAGPR